MGVLMPPYPNFVGDVAEVCVDFEGYGLALSIARGVNGKPYLATMRQRTHCPAPRSRSELSQIAFGCAQAVSTQESGYRPPGTLMVCR